MLVYYLVPYLTYIFNNPKIHHLKTNLLHKLL